MLAYFKKVDKAAESSKNDDNNGKIQTSENVNKSSSLDEVDDTPMIATTNEKVQFIFPPIIRLIILFSFCWIIPISCDIVC